MTRAKSRSLIPVGGLALFVTFVSMATGWAMPDPPNGGACLPGNRGYFQGALRGALQTQLDWRDLDLQCDGGARPDGHGIRLSLAGPVANSKRRLRVIIGVAVPAGESRATATPANVTVIVEGENRVYATLGQENCSVESLRQDPLPDFVAAAGHPQALRGYRVTARGYCIDGVSAVNGSDRLYIDRFDFAALAQFTPESLHAPVTAP